jgi:hypothetical protein
LILHPFDKRLPRSTRRVLRDQAHDRQHHAQPTEASALSREPGLCVGAGEPAPLRTIPE